MAEFVGTLWKELVWVLSPTKSGHVHIKHVDYWNLLVPAPMALGMLTLRYVMTRYCFIPLGVYLGVKSGRQAPPDPVLEEMYSKLKEIPRSQILAVAKQLDMTERQLETWLNRRKKQDRPSCLAKFCESSWKCMYYSCLFVYGVVVLWDKPWLWDISRSWSLEGSLSISSGIWWYYMVSLSFYWSLIFSHCFLDVQRKDFWQMLVHHAATILLMCFSWLAAVYKIGTLVLVVHDCADLFLEAAKMAKYADYQTTCTVTFSIFTVTWLVTRMGIYPFWIVKHTLIDFPKLVPDFPAYYTFNGLLVLLLMLHCYWTYLILKIAAKAVGEGQVEDDVGSSSDESGE